MTLLHLAYLQDISDILEANHKPLAARLGFIAKKISCKHLVHIKGSEPSKLRRCKSCQAPITSDNVKSKDKALKVTCSLCGFSRHFSVNQSDKAKKTKNKTKQFKKEGKKTG